MICLKISIFVVSNTTKASRYSLTSCCDLLENFYLCGIKHNRSLESYRKSNVVICLKISIFVVSNTTKQGQTVTRHLVVICLKISIFVVSNTTNSLFLSKVIGCDLLENFYLCGIKHNLPNI